MPPHGLQQYLMEMKDQGYALVGVEQTSNSKSLTEYHMPEKLVLVLGWVMLWRPLSLTVGWRGKLFLAHQNQHVSKPTWVKLQCNRHSKSALKSALKMEKLAPSEKHFLKAEPNRPFIRRIVSQVWWLINGQALQVYHFLPDFTESVPIFGTPHDHWHIPKVVHKRWE